MRLNILNCSFSRQLYNACLIGPGDGPLQQCAAASLSSPATTEIWCALVPIITASLHIPVAPHTLYQYILQQEQYSVWCLSYLCGVPRSYPPSSKNTSRLMLLLAPQHTWYRPADDVAVQGHCFHARRLEEGQSSAINMLDVRPG